MGDLALAGRCAADATRVQRRCSDGQRRSRRQRRRSHSRQRRQAFAFSTSRSARSPSTGRRSTRTTRRVPLSRNSCARADELGDESARPWLLFLLGELELLVGNVEARPRLRSPGTRGRRADGSAPVHACAHARSRASLRHKAVGLKPPGRLRRMSSKPRSDQFLVLIASAALGLLALSLERPSDVVEHLASQTAFVRREGIVEPGATRFVVDHVEALVELGRLRDATRAPGLVRRERPPARARLRARQLRALPRDSSPRRRVSSRPRWPRSRPRSTGTRRSSSRSTAVGRCSRSAPRSGG